jgi:dihydrolipoamide dehydrogenase
MEVVIVGGGPGGYVAAIRAAQLGASVTLVEQGTVGGTCLNVGCIPTKSLLHSAELICQLREQGAQIGISAPNIQVDFPRVIAHKNEVSHMLAAGVESLLAHNGVKRIQGTASFIAPKTLQVSAKDGSVQTLPADRLILATGSVNAVPPIPGLRETAACIDSTGALALPSLPKTLAIIGGGVIGLEMACAYAGLGSKVTVLEMLPEVLPMMDGELTKIGLRHMKKLGITLYLETTVRSVESTSAGALLRCTDKGGSEIRVEAEKVLVAVGRRANTQQLNLEAGKVANDRGRILTNDKMETNVVGVYAVGDCVFGRTQLAHTASAMGSVAAENALGGSMQYDERTSPTCVYIWPEFAGVGPTEQQAKARGLSYRVGKFPMLANGKALILNGGEGMVKLLSDPENGRILAMHIIGPRASDLIAEGALAIQMHATLDDLISTIHSHPTVSEAVREVALSAEGRAIHIINR